MRPILALVITLASILGAQTGDVIISPAAPKQSVAIVIDNDANANAEYIGKALSPTSYTHRFSVATCGTSYCSALTNLIDGTNTGTVTAANHGLRIGNEVCVTGGTDTDLNACYYVQTVADANTFTITTASVTDATYTTGLVITTRAPRTTDPIWTITKNTFELISSAYYLTDVATSKPNSIWANRAVTTGSTKVTYH